jgi:hypothetical protein
MEHLVLDKLSLRKHGVEPELYEEELKYGSTTKDSRKINSFF